MKIYRSSLALRLSVLFLVLSFLPLGVLVIFVRNSVQDAIVKLVADHSLVEARTLIALVSTSGEKDVLETYVEANTDGSRHSYIVDLNGNYIAHPDMNMIGKQASGDSSWETVKPFLTGGEGKTAGTVREKDTGRIIGYAISPQHNAVAVVVMDSKVIDIPLSDLERSSLLQIAVSLLIISVAGGVIIWLLVGIPLRQLAGTAEQIGLGNLDIKVNAEDMDDELRILGFTFNQMATELKELIVGLEQRVIELYQAKEAQRHSEQRLQTIFDSVNDAIFVHDLATGSILDFNQKMCEMYGYTREEVRSISLQDLSSGEPPYTQGDALKWLGKAAQGEPQLFEWRARHKDGHLFWVEVNMRRVTIDDQDRILVVARDINERKRSMERMELLHEIDRAILSTEKPQDTAIVILSRIRNLITNMAGGSVVLVDAQSNRYEVLASEGMVPSLMGMNVSGLAGDLGWFELLRDGKSYLLLDFVKSSGTSQLPVYESCLALGLQEMLCARLMYRGEIIGFLVFFTKEAGSFSSEHIAIASEMSDQLAIVIQQYRLNQITQQKVKELTGLHEIAQTFDNMTDIRETYGTLVEKIAQLIGARRCVITLLDENEYMQAQAPGYGLSDEKVAGLKWEVKENQATRDFWKIGFFRAQSLADFPEYLRPLARSLEIKTALVVPLKTEHDVVDYIILMDKPDGFSEDDARLLGVFASQISTVIQNARLFDQIQRHYRQTTSLLASAEAISASLKFEDALRVIANQAVALLGAEGNRIHLLEPDGETLRCVIANEEDAEAVMAMPLKLGQGLTGHVAQTGKPLMTLTPDPTGIGIEVPGTPLREMCMALVPLYWREHIVGVMTVSRKGHSHPFTPEDLRLLATLAVHASIAIENSRLFTALTTEKQRLEWLNKVGRELSTSLNSEQVYSSVHNVAAQLMPVEAFFINLLDESRQEIEVSYGYDHGGRTPPQKIPAHRGLSGHIIDSGKPLNYGDISIIRDMDLIRVGDLAEIHSVLAVPIPLGGKVIGMLTAQSYQTNAYTSEDQQILSTLAYQAAIAIQNARLFEKLQQTNTDLSQAYDTTLEGWARALELRNRETAGHARNVVQGTLILARAMGIQEDELVHIRRGALLHDIGKMGIPDIILLKEGPLTEAEWEIMRQHPVYAYNLLSPITFLHPALDIPYCHHEKWDGTGYPRGLKGEQIPLPARIFTIMDVWDALCSIRPYRPQRYLEQEALAYIMEEAGKRFDPKVVEIFLKYYHEFTIW